MGKGGFDFGVAFVKRILPYVVVSGLCSMLKFLRAVSLGIYARLHMPEAAGQAEDGADGLWRWRSIWYAELFVGTLRRGVRGPGEEVRSYDGRLLRDTGLEVASSRPLMGRTGLGITRQTAGCSANFLQDVVNRGVPLLQLRARGGRTGSDRRRKPWKPAVCRPTSAAQSTSAEGRRVLEPDPRYTAQLSSLPGAHLISALSRGPFDYLSPIASSRQRHRRGKANRKSALGLARFCFFFLFVFFSFHATLKPRYWDSRRTIASKN